MALLLKKIKRFQSDKTMYALLFLLVILVRATNETSSAEEVPSAEVSTTEMALKCWRGAFVHMVPGGAIQKMRLWECPEGSARCVKMHCSMDEAALRALQLDHVPPGTKSLTQTSKGCLPATDKCELPDETFLGVSFKSLQKYCKVTCCDGNACNGTLGLRSVGTVVAMMAFFAAVFLFIGTN